jgi:hypothetical protein
MSLFAAILATQLYCPKTRLYVPDGHTVTQLDLETVKRAKVRCFELYPESPCAKYVSRKGLLDYHVVCGSPNQNSTQVF